MTELWSVTFPQRAIGIRYWSSLGLLFFYSLFVKNLCPFPTFVWEMCAIKECINTVGDVCKCSLFIHKFYLLSSQRWGGGGGGGAGVIEACKLNTYSVYAYISCVTSLCLSLNTHTHTLPYHMITKTHTQSTTQSNHSLHHVKQNDLIVSTSSQASSHKLHCTEVSEWWIQGNQTPTPDYSSGRTHTFPTQCLNGQNSTVRHIHCLIGLVVKASASRAEDPRFKSCLRQDFFRVESY